MNASSLESKSEGSAISVPSNIAEGQARKHTAEFRQFLYISLGSLAELDTQIIISEKLGYLNEEVVSLFGKKITELRKMIFGVIRKLDNRNRPPNIDNLLTTDH